LDLEDTNFDLHSLLHTTVKVLTNQAAVKGLNLSCHIGLDTPYKLIGDPFHFRQILNNLVGNAIKFTEKGSVELRCHVKRKDNNNVLIRFEVVDTGIGIPEEVQERIFDKFSQADESTTRKFGGTGLGTAITKQLVELMGGRIGIQSTPNIGTTFWFDIEFKLQADATNDLDVAVLQNCKVLRLTPDPETRTGIASALHGWDVPYQNVANTRDTIRLLMDAAAHNAPFEVLVIDHMELASEIPAFIESIGKDLSLPSINILLTQHTHQPIPTIETGINQLYTFTKPLDKALLFNALHASHTPHFEGDDIISLADHFISEHQAQRKYRILVAEDNSINRMVIGRILERKGHSHREVENGQELLDALEDEEFDLVITDMQMPVVSGIEAYKMYRFAHASEETVPFIMLTANATLEARRECREVGIRHFLTKPVSSQKLIDSISQATAHLSDSELNNSHQASGTATPARNNNSPIIDYKILDDVKELSQGNEFLQRLCNNFERDSQQLLQGMDESMSCGDFNHFKELAHAIKGSAANLGLKELTSLASIGQHMSDPEIKAGGNMHIIEMRKAFSRAMTLLSDEIGLQKPTAR
ncbi:MAG: response regulator, partial [Gammaproteobacteria bacterium]|nr:response regulator [Gammaproteobacteria bacterium]